MIDVGFTENKGTGKPLGLWRTAKLQNQQAIRQSSD